MMRPSTEVSPCDWRQTSPISAIARNTPSAELESQAAALEALRSKYSDLELFPKRGAQVRPFDHIGITVSGLKEEEG